MRGTRSVQGLIGCFLSFNFNRVIFWKPMGPDTSADCYCLFCKLLLKLRNCKILKYRHVYLQFADKLQESMAAMEGRILEKMNERLDAMESASLGVFPLESTSLSSRSSSTDVSQHFRACLVACFAVTLFWKSFPLLQNCLIKYSEAGNCKGN